MGKITKKEVKQRKKLPSLDQSMVRVLTGEELELYWEQNEELKKINRAPAPTVLEIENYFSIDETPANHSRCLFLEGVFCGEKEVADEYLTYHWSAKDEALR